MLKLLLNLIIPSRCVCGDILISNDISICRKCWENIGFISPNNVCAICGDPFEFEADTTTICHRCIESEPHFDIARAVFRYTDISGKMITGIKYSDRTPYIKTLAKFMSNKLNELPGDYDLIVSVPIHRKKLLRRKFNQSALLANNIAKMKNKKVNNLIIRKTKYVPPQASLSRKERLENLKGSMSVDGRYKNIVNGKKILLVDDVITTGTTANECAKILKKAGAEKVYIITAARTVLEK